jgi:hypothetical protein
MMTVMMKAMMKMVAKVMVEGYRFGVYVDRQPEYWTCWPIPFLPT